jgi:hypothetical protein
MVPGERDGAGVREPGQRGRLEDSLLPLPQGEGEESLSRPARLPRMTTLALIAALLWLYLVFAHGRFWQSGPILPPQRPVTAPPVAIVVPARDEAPSIDPVLRSLLAQDYPGP